MFTWIRSFASKAKTTLEKQETQDRIRIAEDTIFGLGSLKVDMEVVDATVKLTDALCKNNSPAVVDTGAFLFVKLQREDGSYFISGKRLSVEERIKLNNDASLIYNPQQISQHIPLQPISLPSPRSEDVAVGGTSAVIELPPLQSE